MWIETILAAIAAAAGVVTLIWPTWFETLVGESPDGGDGSLERLVALLLIAAALVFAGLARRSWRRWSTVPSQAQ